MDPRGSALGIIVGSGASAGALAAELDGDARSVTAAQRQVFATPSAVVLSRHLSSPEAGYTAAHLVDHAANLAALAELGCGRVIGICSVGSLRSDVGVGSVVAPDDFFAPGVAPSIFSDERGHTVPGFDEQWRSELLAVWQHSEASRPLSDGGVYAHMVGPRFETPAEVRFLATVADVVGMTAAAECVLAAEMGMAYATICQVDNMANGIAGDELDPTEVTLNAGRQAAVLVSDLAAVTRSLT